ncbi:MAG: class I SAM-dependent methyltransferase [Deltaproteobacteria bacterium]|jgi:SAM-dependent methyltransferase|nr:class I SAM-dependent methyltransferase [Deltaproteobacteria bacterium]
MHLRYRKTCRVCGSTALAPVLNLGEQHLQGSFVKPGKESPPERRVPLELVRCDVTANEHGCGLVQLRHSTPTEILYSVYWYRSGTNETMRSHLHAIAEEGAKLIGKERARVLDIGCNDGTLLGYYPAQFGRYGVDPSDVARSAPDDVTVVQALFPSEELWKVAGRERFDIITSIAMFYDLEDPVAFVRSVKEALADDGLWIFEMSYMPTMLEMNSYDTICHEHLEYYSLAVLEEIARRAGMRIFDASLNSINGGSIRCYATHADNFKFRGIDPSPALIHLRHREFDLALDTAIPYRDFEDRIRGHRDELSKLVKGLRKQGKRIHLYGASTKGNVILQFCGLDHSVIDCAADRNPEKHGARTLGTDIPIVSEQESRDLQPDYYLVLPWHFRDEFLEREKEMIDRGVGMIFPLPEIEVVKR